MEKTKNQKLNLIQSISLVIGNMIGVGIFMLPASLSEYGSISIFGWIISGIMALLIAVIFRNITYTFNDSNNPIDYLENIFGDFIGFFIIWGYWISILLVNASIAIAITSYLSVFTDIIQKREFAILISILIVLVIAFINYNGIKNTGNFQLITTILKIVPLITTIFLGVYFFDINNFFPINLSSETNFKAITITTTLTFFAFLGIESASIPADKISNPKKKYSKINYDWNNNYFLYLCFFYDCYNWNYASQRNLYVKCTFCRCYWIYCRKLWEKYNCNFCDNLRFRSTKWLDFITNRNS